MARPRKPTALHLLQGSEQKHPDRMRARSNEPQPLGPIGACPDRFSPAVAEAWDFIVDSCAAGVLTSMDRPTLQMAAVLMCRFWECTDQTRDPELGGFLPPEYALLIKLLSSFGMNPSDRSKIIVPKDKKPDSPFAKFRTPAGT